jgi:ABC-2 type transport system ATP-binding protein/nitrous oxidase accessory protein
MIQVKNLTKNFGQTTAVDNLSFSISHGESVALWGPNGAGKTTVIRCLLGLHSAQGTLLIDGFNAQKQGKKARAAVGYVPQELAFYNDMSVRATIRFYAGLKKVAATRADSVLAEVGLSSHDHKQVSALSGGMKQRLALACALLAEPKLFILDEPTSNLDTAAREEFIRLLLKLRFQGKTLLFTSHRLEEVEALASRVLALEEGRLKLVCNTPSELANRIGMMLNLELIIPGSMRENALSLLRAQGFNASRNGIGLKVAVSPTAKMRPLTLLLAENIEVSDFEIENGY